MIKMNLTFSLPEDHEADQLVLTECPAKEGEYRHYETLEYKYGQNKVEVELNPLRWYKLQFYNSRTGEISQTSDAVYAGNYKFGAPALFVSSTTDGAHYATTQDVYEYAGLQPLDIPEARVSVALKKARASIDYRVNDLRRDAFLTFDDHVQRRKFNASLQLIKEAEICIALGAVYEAMSDTLILESMRDRGAATAAGSVSIGGASMAGDSLAERSDSILYLATLGARYRTMGENLLSTLTPSSVPLVSYEDHVRSPKFKYPFHGWPK